MLSEDAIAARKAAETSAAAAVTADRTATRTGRAADDAVPVDGSGVVAPAVPSSSSSSNLITATTPASSTASFGPTRALPFAHAADGSSAHASGNGSAGGGSSGAPPTTGTVPPSLSGLPLTHAGPVVAAVTLRVDVANQLTAHSSHPPSASASASATPSSHAVSFGGNRGAASGGDAVPSSLSSSSTTDGDHTAPRPSAVATKASRRFWDVTAGATGAVNGADEPTALAAFPGLSHSGVGELTVIVARLRRLLSLYRSAVSAEQWLTLCEDMFDVSCYAIDDAQRAATVTRMAATQSAMRR